MSRRLLISVLVSLAAGAAQARVLDCELNGQAVNRNNGNELAGKSGMLRCKDRDDGKIVLEENYTNGRPIVYQKTTGMDGRVTVRNVNANGNSDGPYKSLRLDGSVESEETYANGDRVGEARFFYPNGKLRRLGFYEAGRALNEIEYHDNGQLAALRCGDKAALTEVRDLCGFSGRASEVQLFRSNGDVARTVSYRDGKLVARTSNSAQGTPSETESVEGSDRVVRALHPNGKVKLETRYREQRRHGVEKEFADSGQLTRETTWDLGERTTESRWFISARTAVPA